MRCITILALAAVLAAILAAANARAADAKPEEPELRIYDIHTLTESTPDYPGPSAEFTAGIMANTQAVPNVKGFVPAAVTVPTAASIADMIRSRVRPDQWDAALGTSVEEMGGSLVIMQRPEIHAMIAQLLNAFEASGTPQLVVKGLLVPSAFIPDNTYFDQTGLDQFLNSDPAAAPVAAPRLVCYNKQRVYVMSGTEMAYVRDLDVNGDSYDPAMGTLLSGVVFDVRPTLSADRAYCDVECRVTLNSNVKRNPRLLGTTSTQPHMPRPPQADATVPAVKKEVAKPNPDNGADARSGRPLSSDNVTGIELDLPSMNSDVVRTDVSIPAGKWVLAATLNNNDEKSDKKYLLLFVTAEAIETK
jgi:hypothetical protein